MKPNDKSKKGVAPQPKAKVMPKAAPASGGVRFTAILYNVVGAVVSILFLSALFQHHEPDQMNPTEAHLNSGYDWLLNTMLKGNLETIEKNPDKTLIERYELKWGQGEITYVNKMKAQTPENAIVLLPPKKILQDVGFKSVVDLPWITYFLYPRRIVYEEDKDKSPLYAQATHLISLNGWGLDKIKYTVEKPEQFMVLPINK